MKVISRLLFTLMFVFVSFNTFHEAIAKEHAYRANLKHKWVGHDYARKSHGKLVSKRAKIRKPKTKRHYHPQSKSYGWSGKRRSYQGYVRSARKGSASLHKKPFSHAHDGFLPHTHNQPDILYISPEATQWADPKSRSSLPVIPLFPWEDGTARDVPVTLALVVVEEKSGVNVIRNVKTVTSATIPVREKLSIGSTDLPRPSEVLNDRQVDRCNRRLKRLTDADNATVTQAGAGYCQ